jgi:hypothetical protein
MKVALIDWSQHPHMSSPHNINITGSHFDILLHTLIIYKVHGSFVFGWISMLSIHILIADE